MALRLDFGIWKKGPRFCGALFSIGRDGGGIITQRLRRSAHLAMGMGALGPFVGLYAWARAAPRALAAPRASALGDCFQLMGASTSFIFSCSLYCSMRRGAALAQV